MDWNSWGVILVELVTKQQRRLMLRSREYVFDLTFARIKPLVKDSGHICLGIDKIRQRLVRNKYNFAGYDYAQDISILPV